MKKIFLLFFLILMLCSISAYAKTGDVIGGIYETDILCFINGVEVPSFNIGGQIYLESGKKRNFIGSYI